MEENTAGTGKVFLVGAGPGSAELLSCKAKAVLEKADTVVYDRLVSDDILLGLPAVTLIDVGKEAGRQGVTQEEIERILIDEARAGKTVVRLKGGDPFIFGRGGEEVAALIKAGIPWEAVPGLSSALAVPALAGISLTRRGLSSSLHVISWRGKDSAAPESAFLSALASAFAGAGGTLVILMGGSALREIGAGLCGAGFSPITPAAIIENGARPEQRVTCCTLKELSAFPAPKAPVPPTLVVVGKVCARLFQSAEPFPAQSGKAGFTPLNGLRVVVTRPAEKNAGLCRLITERGGKAIPFPCIKTVARDIDREALRKAAAYNWLVFTSAAGVDFFFDACIRANLDFRVFSCVRFAVVGDATGAALRGRGFTPDFVPKGTFGNRAFLEELREKVTQGETALLVRSAKGGRDLSAGLAENGVAVDELFVYDTLPAEGNGRAKKIIEGGHFDLVFFASPSAVEGFCAAFPGLAYKDLDAICVGETTAESARKRGMKVRVSPEARDEAMCALAAEWRHQ